MKIVRAQFRRAACAWSLFAFVSIGTTLCIELAECAAQDAANPLVVATHRGDVDQMRQLITDDPALVNSRGPRPAAPVGSFLKRWVLAWPCIPQSVAAQCSGLRPLDVAIQCGHPDAARLLMDHGARLSHSEVAALGEITTGRPAVGAFRADDFENRAAPRGNR